MKKLFLLLFCGLLFAAILPLQAKKVEPERAEKVAQSYIESKRGQRGKPAGLRLYRFETPGQECRAVAGALLSAVRRLSWRWRDMAVVCADPAGYHKPLQRALRPENPTVDYFLADRL